MTKKFSMSDLLSAKFKEAVDFETTNETVEVEKSNDNVVTGRAHILHQRILANGNIAAQALVDFAKDLKQMKDEKLYITLGYEKFENYCEEAVGLKRSQAYSYIQIIEKLGDDFFRSNGQFGIRKLELISRLPEEQRAEFIQANEVEEMTTRELDQAIKAQKAAEQRATDIEKEAAMKVTKLSEEVELLKQQNSINLVNYKELDAKYKEKEHEIPAEIIKEVVHPDYENLKIKMAQTEAHNKELDRSLKIKTDALEAHKVKLKEVMAQEQNRIEQLEKSETFETVYKKEQAILEENQIEISEVIALAEKVEEVNNLGIYDEIKLIFDTRIDQRSVEIKSISGEYHPRKKQMQAEINLLTEIFLEINNLIKK